MIFVDWYNNYHRHSGIKFVTPASRHEMRDEEILKARKVIYEVAKSKNPERWKGRDTRNFDYIKNVKLNHLNCKKSDDIKKAS